MLTNSMSSQRCRCFNSTFDPSSFWQLTAMIFALFALFQFHLAAAAPSCGRDEYRVLVGRIGEPGTGVGCLPCSSCPVNQIIRRPCTRVTDTLCGPLYDFEFRNIQQQTVAPAAAAILSRRTWQLSDVTVRSRDVSADAAAGDGNEYSQQSSKGESSLLSTCSGDMWRIFCYSVITSIVVLLCVICVVYFVLRTGRLQNCCGQKHLTDTAESYIAEPEVVLMRLNDSLMVETAVVVDPEVRHLETQLYNNRIQQLVADRLFGSSRPHGRLYNGNEYLDERYRARMMRPSRAVAPSTDTDFSADQQHPELAPLAVVEQRV